MIRLVVTSISVMTLIIGIGYLPGTYAVQTTTPRSISAPPCCSPPRMKLRRPAGKKRKRKMRSRESIGSRVPSVTDSERPTNRTWTQGDEWRQDFRHSVMREPNLILALHAQIWLTGSALRNYSLTVGACGYCERPT